MRLDKLLTQHHFGSRREIKRLLFSKKVSVNGQIVMEGSLNVDPNFQKIIVDGQRLYHSNDIYLMLNKPSGVVSAVSDHKLPTVIDLIKEDVKGLYPVGRLDADTTGLLLITNNGRLGYRLLQPKFHVQKTYAVTVNGLLDESSVLAFNQGIEFLDGTVCKSADLVILESTLTESKALLTIREGKFHQVKKMFLSIGVKVTSLQRVSFGPLRLDPSLKLGEYRHLTKNELSSLEEYFV